MKLLPLTLRLSYIGLLVLVFGMMGCSVPSQTTQQNSSSPSAAQAPYDSTAPEVRAGTNRPVANPISGEIPTAFYEAVQKGSRTMSGKPGNNYWTQHVRYDLDVEVMPADTLLVGHGTITYYNNSPDRLQRLHLELAQNLHKSGVRRNEEVEITGGVQLDSLSVDGNTIVLNPEENRNGMTMNGRLLSGYLIDGTLLTIAPRESLAPGDSVKINIGWRFKIPQQGAGSRMGYSRDNLFYIAYWYPQMRVYDDVYGWMTDPFTGNGEFYQDFAHYDIHITAPEQWLVGATGRLTNSRAVLADDIQGRLQRAHQSDSVIHVVTDNDFGAVTKSTAAGTITWNFEAHNVRDFAFSLTSESKWDATRARIGDRDGNSQQEYAHINTIYRQSAPIWTDAAKFTRDALQFFSEFTDLSYPWPHMTSVEGGGIIGGGMEFPMITIIGSYRGRAPSALYSVIAHELAHMWMPMMVSSNERRYGWMDEGTTTFNEIMAEMNYYPSRQGFIGDEYRSYRYLAGTDLEGPIMRWSDYHYNNYAYGTASYSKPGSVLFALRELLGQETFTAAYREFLDRWKYKHPYPWDLFNTFEDVSGRELDWFWRSWYYETWVLDQAVGNVMTVENGTRIIIEDYGQIPMPSNIEITVKDGTILRRTVPVSAWLEGATQVPITVDGEVTKVVIDPENKYPDKNPANNIWQKSR
jgi:hypothetical protein